MSLAAQKLILLLLVLEDRHLEVLLENCYLIPDLLFELLVFILVVLPSHHLIVFSLEVKSTVRLA